MNIVLVVVVRVACWGQMEQEENRPATGLHAQSSRATKHNDFTLTIPSPPFSRLFQETLSSFLIMPTILFLRSFPSSQRRLPPSSPTPPPSSNRLVSSPLFWSIIYLGRGYWRTNIICLTTVQPFADRQPLWPHRQRNATEEQFLAVKRVISRCKKLHINSPTEKISSRTRITHRWNETEPSISSRTRRSDSLLTLLHRLDEPSAPFDVWLGLLASPALLFWIYR